MDYKKKYKEALERATQKWECGDMTRESLEYIFQELAESEDEKIRKGLINGFKFYSDQEYWGTEKFPLKIKDIIAWLEKQGEQKPVEPQQDMLSQEQYAKAVDECVYGEQKPAWSEEDKRNINDIDSVLFYDKDLPEETCIRLRNWLKSLKERYTWKPSDEQMKLLREVQQALLGKDCHNRFVNFMYELKRLREE